MTTLLDIRKMRYDRTERAWRDHDGKLMEWHNDDPLRFRDAVLWYMCRSKIHFIRNYGWKKWGF